MLSFIVTMTKADKTREYIIEKTAPVFNRKGFAGTSLNDMEAATGLSKGSIYGNFSNKDEVALAVFDYNLQKVTAIGNAAMAGKKTVRGQLVAFANVYKDFLEHPFPAGGCPILNTAVEADDTHPLLKKKATDAVMGWKNKISRLVEKGILNKEFKKTVNPEQIALTMIAMIEGGIMISKITGRKNYLYLVLESVEKMIAAIP